MNLEEFIDLDNKEPRTSCSLLDEIYKTWQEYEDKISKMEFIRDLLKEKFVNTVKELNKPDTLSENILDYINNQDKESTRTLKHRLNFEFGKLNWMLKDITCLGAEIYGFGIPFSLNWKKYRIEAPCFKNLNLDNMYSTGGGKFSLYIYNNDRALTQIYSSRSKKDIAEYIKKLSADNNKLPF